MKLTEIVDRLVVEDLKLTGYLLDETHADGGPKAAFFMHFGFCLAEWSRLKDALLQHALENEIIDSRETRHDSIIHSIEGALFAPDGREPHIRAIWEIRQGESFARFVTAYPKRGKWA